MSEGTLTADAVKEIERLVLDREPKEVEIDGRKYATAQVYDPRKPQKRPTPIEFSTLQGFADFARTEEGGDFVHVDSPTRVVLYGELEGEFRQRSQFALANAVIPDFEFGTYYAATAFTVALLSQFDPGGDRDAVFKITGTVESGAAIKIADDGVSQEVTTRRGVNRAVEQVGPGKLFNLRPFATFHEVEQPLRPFILRIRAGSQEQNRPHSCALIEADGGMWKVGACAAIRDWLKGELGDDIPVLG